MPALNDALRVDRDRPGQLGLDVLQAKLTRAAAATRQIEVELTTLEALARRARQEAVTADIIEIATGAKFGQ